MTADYVCVCNKCFGFCIQLDCHWVRSFGSIQTWSFTFHQFFLFCAVSFKNQRLRTAVLLHLVLKSVDLRGTTEYILTFYKRTYILYCASEPFECPRAAIFFYTEWHANIHIHKTIWRKESHNNLMIKRKNEMVSQLWKSFE